MVILAEQVKTVSIRKPGNGVQVTYKPIATTGTIQCGEKEVLKQIQERNRI